MKYVCSLLDFLFYDVLRFMFSIDNTVVIQGKRRRVLASLVEIDQTRQSENTNTEGKSLYW